MSVGSNGRPRGAGPVGRLLAAAALLALAGCGTAELFADYDLPEAPGTAAAPWPRLVDTPTPPPPGVYSEAAPDPLEGIALGADLGSRSRAAAERAEALAGPVVPDPPRRRAPASVPEPAVDEAALSARAAAAAERAERLSAPVLTEAERERLRRAVR